MDDAAHHPYHAIASIPPDTYIVRPAVAAILCTTYNMPHATTPFTTCSTPLNIHTMPPTITAMPPRL
eukprot:4734129-Pleurochrysis_carterae.AAC.3